VRALGIQQDGGTLAFTDVKTSDWYAEIVRTAHAYGLIVGFEEGTFRPNNMITREQAMVIVAKAMEITELTNNLKGRMGEDILSGYDDALSVASWAKSGVTDSLQAGIVSGRSASSLAPKAHITRAEAAKLIQELMKKSGLF